MQTSKAKVDSPTIAERLAEYASNLRYVDLPEVTVQETKKRIVDGLGCAIGAFQEEPVKIARKIGESVQSSRPATILGTKAKTSADLGSFVNGIMVRYFDYNDTYLSKEPAHPSDNIGACLSVAESEKQSGKDFILALALAYEIQCRLCDAADIRHRGWDHVCYGSVSTALAAGKLMGLTEEQLTQAVNISLNAHIAMRQVRAGELSMWKGISFAEAGRNGVFSALLAREGMTGPSPIFEGEMGFFKQVSGAFTLNTESFGGRKGTFKIDGTIIKYFPAEIHSQTAIWASLEARKEIPSPDEILSVEIDSHEAGYTILGKDPEKWKPATKETADHSLPYIVGKTLLEGKIDNSTYEEKNFTDSKTLEFLKKITVREFKGFTAKYPEAIANRITVKLRSGKVISKQVEYPKGHPKNPITNEEVENKYRRLAGAYFGESQLSETLSSLWNLDSVEDLSKLTAGFLIKK
jgi:2-methylcitrate dehydratase